MGSISSRSEFQNVNVSKLRERFETPPAEITKQGSPLALKTAAQSPKIAQPQALQTATIKGQINPQLPTQGRTATVFHRAIDGGPKASVVERYKANIENQSRPEQGVNRMEQRSELQRQIGALNLAQKKMSMGIETREQFQEKVMKSTDQLAELALHSGNSPGIQKQLSQMEGALQKLAQGDPKLEGHLNKEMKAAHSLAHAVKDTGSHIDPNITLSQFLNKNGVSKEDVALEARTFDLSTKVAELKLAKRAVVLSSAGLSTTEHSPSIAKGAMAEKVDPSVMKACYSAFKDSIRNPSEEGKEIRLSEHNAVIYTTGKEVFLQKDLTGAGAVGAGAFKITFVLSRMYGEGLEMVSQKPHTKAEEKAFEKAHQPQDEPSTIASNDAKSVLPESIKMGTSNAFSTMVVNDDGGGEAFSTMVVNDDGGGEAFSTMVVNDDGGGEAFSTTVVKDDGEDAFSTSVVKEDAFSTSVVKEDSFGTTVVKEEVKPSSVFSMFGGGGVQQEEGLTENTFLEGLKENELEKHKTMILDDLVKNGTIPKESRGMNAETARALSESRPEDGQLKELAQVLQIQETGATFKAVLKANKQKMTEKEEYSAEIKLQMSLNGKSPFIEPGHKVIVSSTGEEIILKPAAGIKLPDSDIYAVDLDKFTDNYSSLSAKEKAMGLEILRDSMKGLETLHEMGYVHRDIKPANFLVSKSNTGQVTDFGTMVRVDGTDGRKGSFLGTPLFSPPESTVTHPSYKTTPAAIGALDGKMDVWSVGISMQMLMGENLTDHPVYAKFKDIPDPNSMLAELARLNKKKDTRAAYEARCEAYVNSAADDKQRAARQLIVDCTRADPKERLTMTQARERLDNWLTSFGDKIQ